METCEHEPIEAPLPEYCHRIDGLVVVDDVTPDSGWHPFARDSAPSVVPCKYCGAPLHLPRDDGMRAHRSWLIEKGFGDPLSPSSD